MFLNKIEGDDEDASFLNNSLQKQKNNLSQSEEQKLNNTKTKIRFSRRSLFQHD